MGNNQACFTNASHLTSNAAGEEWVLQTSQQPQPQPQPQQHQHQHQHYHRHHNNNHNKDGHNEHYNKNGNNNNTTTSSHYEKTEDGSLELTHSNLSALNKNNNNNNKNTNPEDESPQLRPKLLNDISPTYASTVSDDAFGYNDGGVPMEEVEKGKGEGEREEDEGIEIGVVGVEYVPHHPDAKKKTPFEFNVDTYVPKNDGQNEDKSNETTQNATENEERETISSELGVEIIKTLGDGVSGTVFEVQDVRTGQRYAMKRLRRSDKLAEWLFITECTFLKKVRCKGVIEMVDCFVDDKYYYILTELGTIDLFTRLKSEKRIPENVCREIIFRLLKTLALLHKHNVVHRDVKPENIVFTKKGTLSQPKMIDFGDAVVVKDHQLYNELVGTRCYLSPERWRQHYGYELKASDVWAVGVLTYEMVTGKRCFYASSDDRLTEKIQCGKWQFPPDSCVSDLCADFIKRMLTLSPKRRPTAEYAMKHPFFTCVNDSDVEGEISTNGVDIRMRSKHALGIWCGEFTRRSTYFSRHMTSIEPVV